MDSLKGKGVRPGLENIEELLHRLGDPQVGMRTVHVAGSDGKGSVCAMVESILLASDMLVGMFTSPSIMRVNESIRIGGEEIADDDLEDVLSMVRPHVEAMAAEGMECTSFEVLTATALLQFHRVDVDIAVVEVGMGGRLDSTNVVVPEVVAINNVCVEHREFLGDNLRDIAYEKAGIMKHGVPCVTVNEGVVLDVLESRSDEVGCTLNVVRRSEVEVVSSRPDQIDMVYEGVAYTVGLPGRHQAYNAALAIGTVSMLSDFHDRIEEHVHEGLENVVWPCRMQKMMGMPVVVDVTHTVNGAECLRRDIEEIYGSVLLVIGMLEDKDLDGVSRELAEIADRVYVTAPDSPRAAPSERMFEVMCQYHDDVTEFSDVAFAMDDAMDTRGDSTILVTGSFRMAEDVLRWLMDRSSRS